MNYVPQEMWDEGPQSKIPCVTPDCTSSDGASVFLQDDQLAYKCFVCGHFETPKDAPEVERVPEYSLTKAAINLPNATSGKWKIPTKPYRGVPANFLKYYKVKVVQDGERTVSAQFPYFGKGAIKRVKLKSEDPKGFLVEGKGGESFFGQHLFPADPKGTLIIVEGELDAPSARYMTQAKYPVVSCEGTDQVLKAAKEEYEWLSKWDRVVVCLDNDDVGRAAAEKLCMFVGASARMFEHHPECKDANDYIKLGKETSFIDRLHACINTPYKAPGIKGIKDIMEAVTEKVKPLAYWWHRGLNRILSGIFPKRLIVILAGSGSGKSTFLRQVVYGIWKQKPEDKIGMMFLEESSLETLQRLVAQISGKAAHLPENYVYYDEKTEEYIESDVPLEDSNLETVNVPDSNWAPGEKLKFAGMLAEGDRWVIWDNFSNLDPDTVLERMEYMHKVHNVTVIAFDHISMVVSGNPTQDERKTIDAFMTRMRHFVEATGVTVITINHLVKGSGQGKSAEEGGMVTLKDSKGAGSVYQLADVVITAVRNQIAEDEEERTRVDYYVLKNRPTSKAGKAGSAKYSIASDRLIEDQQPVL